MANSRPSLRVQLAAIATAIICISVVSSHSASSAEPKWPSEPYKYIVVDQDLRDVLTEFGRNIGVPTKISDAVAGRRVRSEFTALRPREFLQRMCKGYGLTWYFDGTVLHINVDSEIRTELITLVSVRPERLVERLSALGVGDSRYAIRTTDDTNVVSVSGPPPFLSLVRQTVAALEKSMTPQPIREVPNGDEIRVRVFRGNRAGS
jgi:type II secretory pathway component GspD/PulD (secretin)